MERVLSIPMQYDYSTKNKHKYASPSPEAGISEVYISRAVMPTPRASIEVQVKFNLSPEQSVGEKIRVKA